MPRKNKTFETDSELPTADQQPEQTEQIDSPAVEHEETATTKEPEPVNDTTSKAEATIYVGPALPGGQLARYTVFRDGKLMPHVQAIADECQAVKVLIVPVSKLAATERKLHDSSSVEASRYAEINKYFRSKGASK